MSWIYNGKVFEDKDIPEGSIGFVYQMGVIINGSSYAYIGKKNFFANTKKKLTKKAMPTDKRLKKYTRVSKTAYQNYYSSNDVLKKHIKMESLFKDTFLKYATVKLN